MEQEVSLICHVDVVLCSDVNFLLYIILSMQGMTTAVTSRIGILAWAEEGVGFRSCWMMSFRRVQVAGMSLLLPQCLSAFTNSVMLNIVCFFPRLSWCLHFYDQVGNVFESVTKLY